jgi:nucleoside-diphosphate-sugar epimerase
VSEQSRRIFVMGANGFIGKEVVKEALRRGWTVKALVRDPAAAGDLAAAGAELVQGDAALPAQWIGGAAASDVLIDLVQPRLPSRIGLKAIRQIAGVRVENMAKLLAALETIPRADRPVLMAVSGLDDLAPDEEGCVRDDSPLRAQPSGFGHIGIPVRQLLERSGINWTFACLGTVYGPGKAFATTVFPQLAAGRFRMAGDGNHRMPLVHVEDAARAIVHLAAFPADRLRSRSFVIADGSNATFAEFAGCAAQLLGAPRPRSAPLWLARLVLGRVLCETLTRAIRAVPTGLVSSGFAFRYPSHVEGLPPTLEQLGYGVAGTRGPTHRAGPGFRVPFWAVLIAAVGSLLAENLLNFPGSVPRMRVLSGGLGILDERPWYSNRVVYQLLDALGTTGRSAYLHYYWTVDLWLPFIFAVCLTGAIQRGAFHRLAWVALRAAAIDYAENTAVSVLLWRYPEHLPSVVAASSMLTTLKWVAYLSAIVLAVAGFVAKKRRGADESIRTPCGRISSSPRAMGLW